jgi:hypothetical protein
MVRTRLLLAVVALGLGLASGCTNLGQGQLMSRFRTHHDHEEACPCETAGTCSDGPVLGDPGITTMPGPGAVVTEQPAIQSGAPPLAPAPRLVPQPQAQPRSYTPTPQ